MIETALSISHYVLLAGGIVLAFVYRQFRLSIARDLAEMRNNLEETRRCNEEFAEAVRLFEYGAIDEAVEISRRWRERAESD